MSVAFKNPSGRYGGQFWETSMPLSCYFHAVFQCLQCAKHLNTVLKLVHTRTTSILHHHLYRIARLWNYLLVISLTLPAHIIKQRKKSYHWEQFTSQFNPGQTCCFHLLCPCYWCSRQSIPTNFNQSASTRC